MERDDTMSKACTEFVILNELSFFHIEYQGMLPLYKENDLDYTKNVKKYYFDATSESYAFKEVMVRYDKAVIHIRHHFKNLIRRDLDNRNRKYIIDAIRHSGIISDDNWQHISLYEEGVYNPLENMVEVFVVPKQEYLRFMLYLKNTDAEQRYLNENPTYLEDVAPQIVEHVVYNEHPEALFIPNSKTEKKDKLTGNKNIPFW